MTELSDSGRQLTQEDLTDFELNKGVVLPMEYRNFLLRANGGVPSPAAFLNSESEVEFFLHIDGRQHRDLEDRWLLIEDRLPSNMMPIADDAFGNSVLIQTDGTDVGSVWFWDHEDPDNLLKIADDFDAFFDGLEEPDLE